MTYGEVHDRRQLFSSMERLSTFFHDWCLPSVGNLILSYSRILRVRREEKHSRALKKWHGEDLPVSVIKKSKKQSEFYAVAEEDNVQLQPLRVTIRDLEPVRYIRRGMPHEC